ncbi:ribosomal protein L13 [Batrachochytrium salamandrivorans]|nr:ribosomal protein L13 [Batrachochytrium salamandrivorans]
MSSGKTLQTVHRWVVVDANEQIVGRMATQLAPILMGKNKPTYSPHMDHGDNVVVINCQGMQFTGDKYDDKRYVWHTGYHGSQRSRSPKYFAEAKGNPEEILYRAVRGMIPKNNLREDRMFRLVLSKDKQLPAKVLANFPPEVIAALGLVQAPKFPKRSSAPLQPIKDLYTKEFADKIYQVRRDHEAYVNAQKPSQE